MNEMQYVRIQDRTQPCYLYCVLYERSRVHHILTTDSHVTCTILTDELMKWNMLAMLLLYMLALY